MKINKLKIVLDTNVFLVAIPPHSPYRLIFDELIADKYELYITNEILTEYEEVIARKYDYQLVKDIFELFLVLPNVQKIDPYFHWSLIENDPDDNKFVDCAVSASADLLVTNDKHFGILKTVDFPKINLCKAADFKDMLIEL